MAVELHLIGMTDDRKLWHTFRDGGGSWEPFGNAINQAEGINPTTIQDVACAVDPQGNLHVVLVANDGQLLHTMRLKDRSWARIGTVRTAQGDQLQQGKFTAVAATAEGRSLHVVAAKDDQKLYYTRWIVTNTGARWDPALTAFAPADPPTQPPLASRRFTLLRSEEHTSELQSRP